MHPACNYRRYRRAIALSSNSGGAPCRFSALRSQASSTLVGTRGHTPLQISEISRSLGASAELDVPRLARGQHFVRRLLPPVVRRENLDLVEPAIARGFDPRADQRDVDDPVAHHAAIQKQIGGGHEPVADVEREDAPLPRALD